MPMPPKDWPTTCSKCIHVDLDGKFAEQTEHIIALSFAAAVGITFLFLGCALPQYNNWWPMFIIIFYLLSPIPMSIARHYQDSVESTNALVEVAIFITTGIVVSAFGLPIILAHAPLADPIIHWGACALVLTGNTIVFCTILAYFYLFCEDGVGYNGW